MQTTSLPRLMNEHEAAEYLAVRVATLRRWRWAGRGPRFVKIGAAVRYDPTDLDAVIEAGRRTSTSDRGPEAASHDASRRESAGDERRS